MGHGQYLLKSEEIKYHLTINIIRNTVLQKQHNLFWGPPCGKGIN
jgi:hypothetical protein